VHVVVSLRSVLPHQEAARFDGDQFDANGVGDRLSGLEGSEETKNERQKNGVRVFMVNS